MLRHCSNKVWNEASESRLNMRITQTAIIISAFILTLGRHTALFHSAP